MVCTFGSITVTANSSTNLPVCTGFTDVCINITDIGGDLPASNHSSINNCHVMTPYGQTGTTSTSSACGVISWSASQSTSGWVIQ